MRGTWRSETTLREHKNGGPAWTRRLWRPVLYQLSYGPRNCGASSKPNRTVSPRGPAAHGVDALQLTLNVMVTVPPAGTFAVWGLGLVTVQLAATLEGVSITW